MQTSYQAVTNLQLPTGVKLNHRMDFFVFEKEQEKKIFRNVCQKQVRTFLVVIKLMLASRIVDRYRVPNFQDFFYPMKATTEDWLKSSWKFTSAYHTAMRYQTKYFLVSTKLWCKLSKVHRRNRESLKTLWWMVNNFLIKRTSEISGQAEIISFRNIWLI